MLEEQSKSKVDISQIIKDNKKIFSIYPGSRLSEINVLTPILFAFIKKMNEKYKDLILSSMERLIWLLGDTSE